MSWAQELYNVYEKQCGKDLRLLPIFHSTANAQIEVTLKQDGTFVNARALTKEEGLNTIIPVTEDSGARANGVFPMPFADKLIYLAGDYPQFTDGKRADNKLYYEAYLAQLQKWHESPHTHPAVDAVYAYLSAGTLMHDLIESRVLQMNEETGRLADKISIAGIAQEDSFVRFRVYGECPETWLDNTMYKSFIAFNGSNTEDAVLCYATGEIKTVTYKHPSKLRNTGDKAKLISANDESGFTYRGRFADKTEAIAVSYEFSQKMHNALRWLIQRQSVSANDILVSSASPEERKEIKQKEAEKPRSNPFQFDSLQLIVWTSALQDEPDCFSAGLSDEDLADWDDPDFGSETGYDPGLDYQNRLRKHIYRGHEPGSKLQIDAGDKVMLMGVDAATTGRLSVVIYEELEHSSLLKNLVNWHTETAVMRYFPKIELNRPNSFSVRDIIHRAYGIETDKGYLECKPELMKETVLRLLPCITQGQHLPADIVQNLVRKASNPLAYNKCFRTVLETACGMIRKFNIDRKKGVIAMAFDPNEKERSYLFGCLLAIADAAEYASYDDDDKGKRVTNAKRYWSMFAKRPSSTWAVIEKQIRVYITKLGKKGIFYDKLLNDVMEKFNMKDFADNTPLSPAYLLGYHQFNAVIYKKKEEE